MSTLRERKKMARREGREGRSEGEKTHLLELDGEENESLLTRRWKGRWGRRSACFPEMGIHDWGGRAIGRMEGWKMEGGGSPYSRLLKQRLVLLLAIQISNESLSEGLPVDDDGLRLSGLLELGCKGGGLGEVEVRDRFGGSLRRGFDGGRHGSGGERVVVGGEEGEGGERG